MEVRYIIRKVDQSNNEDMVKVMELRKNTIEDYVGGENEYFKEDPVSEIYLMELANGTPLATMTLTPDFYGIRLRMLAVAKKYQKGGVAAYLIRYLIWANVHRLKPGQFIHMMARVHLVEWYKTFGSKEVGKPFLRWGQPHQILFSTVQDDPDPIN